VFVFLIEAQIKAHNKDTHSLSLKHVHINDSKPVHFGMFDPYPLENKNIIFQFLIKVTMPIYLKYQFNDNGSGNIETFNDNKI
jgi:hypothetical protein